MTRPSLREVLTAIIAASDGAAPGDAGERRVVDATGWLEDDDDLDELYDAWSQRWAAEVDDCRGVLGSPSYDDDTARVDVDAWYPDAIRIACWRRGERTIYLALEHADRETPIAITLGWIDDAEIAALR